MGISLWKLLVLLLAFYFCSFASESDERSSDMSEVKEKCLVDMNVFQVILKCIINYSFSLWDTEVPFSSPWRLL